MARSLASKLSAMGTNKSNLLDRLQVRTVEAGWLQHLSEWLQGSSVAFSPNRNCWGPLLIRTRKRAWRDGWHAARELGAHGVWMGGTRLWSARSLAWWHAARGPRSLDVGWEARSGAGGPRFWMAGTRLWSRAPAVLMHVPGTFNMIVRRLGHSMYSFIFAKSYD